MIFFKVKHPLIHRSLAHCPCPSLLPLTASRQLRRYSSGHGHVEGYEPGGHIFGEKPPPPGQKRKWEDWEATWYIGWSVALVTFVVTQYYKPNTSLSDWAYVEAKKRLRERGELVYDDVQPPPKSFDAVRNMVGDVPEPPKSRSKN